MQLLADGWHAVPNRKTAGRLPPGTWRVVLVRNVLNRSMGNIFQDWGLLGVGLEWLNFGCMVALKQQMRPALGDDSNHTP